MQTTITGRHMEISTPLKLHIEARIGKLTRFYDRLHDVHVVVTKDGPGFHAEITMTVNHQRLIARADGTDPHPAVDAATEKMERQLKDLRDRITERKGHPPARDATAGASEATSEPLG